MIGSIKSKIVSQYIDSLNKRNASKEERGVNTLSSITLLAPSTRFTLSEVNQTVRFFREQGVKCYGFLMAHKKTEMRKSAYIEVLSRRDFSWLGIPKQEILIKWLAHKTDLLIAINSDNSPLLRYLCASSNSKLKSTVDFGYVQDDAIDFQLELDEPCSKSLKELSTSVYEALQKVS